MDVRELPRILVDAAAIARRVGEIAGEIDAERNGRRFLLLGVLTGAYVFVADLSRSIRTPHDVAFVRARSYGDEVTPAARVEIDCLDLETVRGRDVLVVEDVLDTGHTLASLQATLRDAGAVSVRTCVLLAKKRGRPFEVPVDFVGFEVADVWVVGYGIDCRGEWRQLPFVGEVDPDRGEGDGHA